MDANIAAGAVKAQEVRFWLRNLQENHKNVFQNMW